MPSNRIQQSPGFLIGKILISRGKVSADTTMVEDYDSIESDPDSSN